MTHSHFCPVCNASWEHENSAYCRLPNEYWCDAHIGVAPLPERLANNSHDHYCEHCYCPWGHMYKECRLPEIHSCPEHGGFIDDIYAEQSSKQQTQSEDLFEQLGRAAWEGIQERTRSLPVSEFRTVPANERIIKAEAVSADRRDVNSDAHKRSLTQRSGLDISDDDLIANYEREDKGIRAIWKFIRETVSMLGVVLLGWDARLHDAILLQTQPEKSKMSVRLIWPWLTGAGIVTAWLFSPFNAFPAIILLTLSLQYGFNCLKKRPSPIFLRSALLFLVLFVLTGIVHDAYFDHPAALCVDGRYSYSASKSGTCSWHDGVSRWNPRRKHWWQQGTEFDSSGTPNYKGRRSRLSSRF